MSMRNKVALASSLAWRAVTKPHTHTQTHGRERRVSVRLSVASRLRATTQLQPTPIGWRLHTSKRRPY